MELDTAEVCDPEYVGHVVNGEEVDRLPLGSDR
jgi:hypothetical protein